MTRAVPIAEESRGGRGDPDCLENFAAIVNGADAR